MKRSYLLVIAGGILLVVGFFLPFDTLHFPDQVFGSSKSMWAYLLEYLQRLSQFTQKIYWFITITNVLFFLLEPIGVLLLFASGLFASRGHRAAYIWGIGVIPAFTFLLWDFTRLLVVYLFYAPPIDVGKLFQPFGVGYWLAMIGCGLGLVGLLLGWLTQRAPAGEPRGALSGRRALRARPEALLLLAGGLATALGFVLPYDQTDSRGVSLFVATDPMFSLLSNWPIPLAALLLLACGLLALLGRKEAYLGVLSGALVGLSYLLILSHDLFALKVELLGVKVLGVGYWLMILGCALGLIGAVLGLWKRPAAPVPADALLAPTSS